MSRKSCSGLGNSKDIPDSLTVNMSFRNNAYTIGASRLAGWHSVVSSKYIARLHSSEILRAESRTICTAGFDASPPTIPFHSMVLQSRAQ